MGEFSFRVPLSGERYVHPSDSLGSIFSQLLGVNMYLPLINFLFVLKVHFPWLFCVCCIIVYGGNSRRLNSRLTLTNVIVVSAGHLSVLCSGCQMSGFFHDPRLALVNLFA